MPNLNKILIHRPLVFEIKINLISFLDVKIGLK